MDQDYKLTVILVGMILATVIACVLSYSICSTIKFKNAMELGYVQTQIKGSDKLIWTCPESFTAEKVEKKVMEVGK